MYRLLCSTCGLTLSLDTQCAYCGADGEFVECLELTGGDNDEPYTE